MSAGWIGVDLDGTLAHYDGWRGIDHIGEPIGPMVDRVKGWLAVGREVRIFTARATELEARIAIRRWLKVVFGEAHAERMEITNVKDFQMIELWDDRAVQVIANTGQPVGQSTRGL